MLKSLDRCRTCYKIFQRCFERIIIRFILLHILTFVENLTYTMLSYVLQQKRNGNVDLQSDFFHSLSKDELVCAFHSLGDQLLYLWNMFLQFHRFAFDLCTRLDFGSCFSNNFENNCSKICGHNYSVNYIKRDVGRGEI